MLLRGKEEADREARGGHTEVFQEPRDRGGSLEAMLSCWVTGDELWKDKEAGGVLLGIAPAALEGHSRRLLSWLT